VALSGGTTAGLGKGVIGLRAEKSRRAGAHATNVSPPRSKTSHKNPSGCARMGDEPRAVLDRASHFERITYGQSSSQTFSSV
jgi:hypothetical protein